MLTSGRQTVEKVCRPLVSLVSSPCSMFSVKIDVIISTNTTDVQGGFYGFLALGIAILLFLSGLVGILIPILPRTFVIFVGMLIYGIMIGFLMDKTEMEIYTPPNTLQIIWY